MVTTVTFGHAYSIAMQHTLRYLVGHQPYILDNSVVLYDSLEFWWVRLENGMCLFNSVRWIAKRNLEVMSAFVEENTKSPRAGIHKINF